MITDDSEQARLTRCATNLPNPCTQCGAPRGRACVGLRAGQFHPGRHPAGSNVLPITGRRVS